MQTCHIGFAGLVCLSGATYMALQSTPTDAPAELRIDDAIVSNAVYDDTRIGEAVPPTFDPNWIPEEPEPVVLTDGGDFGFIGFTSTGWNPPDPDIAVGPNGVLVAVNGGVRYYNRNGIIQWVRALTGGAGLWGPQGAQTFVFDPVLVYDPHTDRFIIVAVEHVGSTDHLLLGISNDSDPESNTGYNDFQKYRWNVNSSCGFIDFPNLGVDEDTIYVTTDCFSSPAGNKAWIIDKQAAIDGTAGVPGFIQMSGGFLSLGDTKNYDTKSPAQYFASAEVSSNALQLKAIIDSLGSPQQRTFMLTVPFFSSPPDAQQLGSSSRLATVGRRIKNGVVRDDTMWISHTISSGGIARTRWYEIALNGWPLSGSNPTLTQEGTIDLGAGIYNWFADVDVDEAGNMGVAFNRSSASEYVGVSRTYRLAGDAAGTVRPDMIQIQSTAPDTSGRWGDYGGIQLDPLPSGDTSSFWNMHEYRTTSWRTWVGRFNIEFASSCPEDLDGDGVVAFSDVLEVLGNWGGGGPEGDANEDGTVDFGDILAILAAWGAC